MSGTQPRHERLANVGDNRKASGHSRAHLSAFTNRWSTAEASALWKVRFAWCPVVGGKRWCWEPQGRSFYTEFSRITPSTCSLALSFK